MNAERKYALLLDMPGGKLPGFYAQIVKALAAKAPLFDRDKELLIFSTDAEREDAVEIMEHYKIAYDFLELLLLPSGAEMSPSFTDYGLVSRSEHIFVYADQVSLFRLVPSPSGEPTQALEQMNEHLLARCPAQASPLYAVETHLIDLMAGIAKAYSCSIELLDL